MLLVSWLTNRPERAGLTLLPLLLAGLNHLLSPAAPQGSAAAGALLLWDFTMLGVVALHWALVLTLGLACVIVRVMKGPGYVADAYAMPQASDGDDAA